MRCSAAGRRPRRPTSKTAAPSTRSISPSDRCVPAAWDLAEIPGRRLRLFQAPRSRIPMRSLILPLLLASLVVPTTHAAEDVTILNASYDVAREFYKDFNPLFVAHWKQKTG